MWYEKRCIMMNDVSIENKMYQIFKVGILSMSRTIDEDFHISLQVSQAFQVH